MRASLWLPVAGAVLAGPGWAGAQTGLMPPPGHVRVVVEFRQAAQSVQGGTVVQGTGPGGTIVQAGPRGARGSAQVQGT